MLPLPRDLAQLRAAPPNSGWRVPKLARALGLLTDCRALIRQTSELTALLHLLPAAGGHIAWQSLLAAKPTWSGGCAGLGSPLRADYFSLPRGFSHNWIIVRMGRSSPKARAFAPPALRLCGISWGAGEKWGPLQVPRADIELSCDGTLRRSRPEGCAQGGAMTAHV